MSNYVKLLFSGLFFVRLISNLHFSPFSRHSTHFYCGSPVSWPKTDLLFVQGSLCFRMVYLVTLLNSFEDE